MFGYQVYQCRIVIPYKVSNDINWMGETNVNSQLNYAEKII